MNILITGGTGTLGQAVVKRLLKNYYNVDRIIVYSRNEAAQVAMRNKYPEGGTSGLRYFIGDVRDLDRLTIAMKGVDVVIHAAAIKSVDVCEYNAYEAVETNIHGTKNVVEACVRQGVNKALLVSTDKAPHPTTLYGATKMVAERLFINGNIRKSTMFSATRYGNVIGSNSSVIPQWERMAQENKELNITDFDMTRFFWALRKAAEFVLYCLKFIEGGEIFIPKMKSYKISDIAATISNKMKETGVRGYEKIHERLITPEEVAHTYESKDHFTIYPFQHDWVRDLTPVGNRVDKNFCYQSDINTQSISNKEQIYDNPGAN